MRIGYVSAALALSGLATALVGPAPKAPAPRAALADMLPDEIDGWREIQLNNAVLPADWEPAPGDDVAFRAYRDAYGRIVTLVVATGDGGSDSVRLHRPETCYTAQGFAILGRDEFAAAEQTPPIVFLRAQNAARTEAISYWLREGGAYNRPVSSIEKIFDVAGAAALFRVSSTALNAQDADLHRAFIDDFLAAADRDLRSLLLAESQ